MRRTRRKNSFILQALPETNYGFLSYRRPWPLPSIAVLTGCTREITRKNPYLCTAIQKEDVPLHTVSDELPMYRRTYSEINVITLDINIVESSLFVQNLNDDIEKMTLSKIDKLLIYRYNLSHELENDTISKFTCSTIKNYS